MDRFDSKRRYPDGICQPLTPSPATRCKSRHYAYLIVAFSSSKNAISAYLPPGNLTHGEAKARTEAAILSTRWTEDGVE